jgi:hypothetical protein
MCPKIAPAALATDVGFSAAHDDADMQKIRAIAAMLSIF